MRINDDIPSRGVEKKGKGSASRKEGGAGSPFASGLSRQVEARTDMQQELHDLKAEIERAGDDLEREPTMANFKSFRNLISQLSRKVLTGAYKLELQSGPASPRCHEIIAVIDREADELYRLIISEQKDRLKITHKIMELKGLVVDFLL